MTRFYWLLGTTIGVVASAWAISSVAQDARPQPPAGFAAPMPPQAMGQAYAPMAPPVASPFPAPPPMMMAAAFGPPPFPPGPPPGPPPAPMMMAMGGGGLGIFGPPPPPGAHGPGQPPRFTEMCLDRLAGKSAFWSYLKSRLDLTPQQLTLWHDIETALGENEQAEREACAKVPPKPEETGFVQRAEDVQSRLTAELARLKKLDGPLHKLAETLSPDQRRLLDQLPPVPL
ncbi:MAG: Spy/CpxP family protein refolding chaperone [Proteobacteria bacterium]|nr:Spy/CpxP family protein refolding chaperone [Pseudomonadota bacterium]